MSCVKNFLSKFRLIAQLLKVTFIMGNVSGLLKEEFKVDTSRVVQDYDDFLRKALATTSSFQDILSGKLNQRNRFWQLILLIHYFVYTWPRYFTLCYLYTRDDITRLRYQYLLADCGEELGLWGRTFNVCYVVFGIEVALNLLVMRKYESSGSLEYLTDWTYRTPGKTEIEEEEGNENAHKTDGHLDNEVNNRLLSQLHFKTVIAKMLARLAMFSLFCYEVIALLLFLYRKRPSLSVSCLAVYNFLFMLLFVVSPGNQFHALYLSFIAVTDYFKERMRRITKGVTKLQTSQLTNESLTKVLNDYDELMTVFKKYNKVLKHLLRNLVHFYSFGLTCVFLIFTLQTEIWMLLFMTMPAVVFSLIILATGVYISQLHGMVFKLHNEMACIPARHSNNKKVSLKNIIRLRLVIKELGSLETDGQFVIGLRDGHGSAISRLEIFELTLATLGNTLMIIDMVKNQ